jgi:hypothetical protein
MTRPLVLLALILAAGAALLFVQRRAPDAEPATLTWIADAHQLGPVGYRDPAGALSPDGQWIAYAEGRFLRVRPAGGGPIAALPAGEAQIRNLAWGADSRTIAADGYRTQSGWALYDRAAGTRRGLWSDHDPLIGTLGDGAETKAVVADLRQLSWSPDGRTLAGIVNGREGQQLWIVAADGASAPRPRACRRSRRASPFPPGRRAARSPASPRPTAARV